VTVRLSDVGKNSFVDGFGVALNGASLVYYTGTQPRSANTELDASHVELLRLTLPTPACHPSVDAQLEWTVDSLIGQVKARGVPTFVRVLSATGRTLADMAIHAADTAGSATDFVVDDVENAYPLRVGAKVIVSLVGWKADFPNGFFQGAL
jgi:hypothetical protein